MTVTYGSPTRIGNYVTITVTSDLVGTVYFHWYLDGAWVGETRTGERTFYLEDDDQLRLEVLDTTDADYDPVANAPTAWPARRTISWTRPGEADVVRYKIEQQKDGGAWTQIGIVHQDDRTWWHQWRTDRLTDLSTYSWRITPIDAAGNEGTAKTIGSEKIVRTPDSPRWAYTFNTPATTVTFSAA